MSDELVRLTVVGSESEAALLCGYLESQGIEASYETGGIDQLPAAGLGGPYMGHQEVRVRASDLEAARAALESLPK